MFQIQELTSYFDAEWSPEHFDTFLNQIDQKTKRCRPKNCIYGVGNKKINFCHFSRFINILRLFLVILVYIVCFEIKQFIESDNF